MSAPGYFSLVLVWDHFNILPKIIKNLHTQYKITNSKMPPRRKRSLLDCFLCRSKLLNSEDLFTHFEEIHPNNFRYRCENCNQKIWRLIETRYHQCEKSAVIASPRIIENPVFRCKICFKVFTQQNDLTNHVKSHSPIKIILSRRGIPIKRH